jgi:hypothetical protein
MSIATNLLLIVLGINLMLFIFGSPENNSPMLAILKAVFTGSVDWTYLFSTIGYAAAVYLTLMGFVILAGIATGTNYLTTGGGQGSVVALQIVAIAIFSSLCLMPNFSTFGFPTMIEYVLNIFFGGMITVTVISLLRGY